MFFEIISKKTASELRGTIRKLVAIVEAQQSELVFLRKYVANLDQHKGYASVAKLDESFLRACGVLTKDSGG